MLAGLPSTSKTTMVFKLSKIHPGMLILGMLIYAKPLLIYFNQYFPKIYHRKDISKYNYFTASARQRIFAAFVWHCECYEMLPRAYTPPPRQMKCDKLPPTMVSKLGLRRVPLCNPACEAVQVAFDSARARCDMPVPPTPTTVIAFLKSLRAFCVCAARERGSKQNQARGWAFTAPPMRHS